MLEWATSIIERMGYGGIVFLMVLENVFPPIPSEVILPFAGFTASKGRLSLIGVIVAASTGSMLGAVPYTIWATSLALRECGGWLNGMVAGSRFPGVISRCAMEWFRGYGAGIVLVGRIIPGLRSVVSIPAGICGMTLSRFFLYSAAGTAVWSGLLVYLGWLLGKNYETVAQYVAYVSYGVAAVIIGAVIIWIIRRKGRSTF